MSLLAHSFLAICYNRFTYIGLSLHICSQLATCMCIYRLHRFKRIGSRNVIFTTTLVFQHCCEPNIIHPKTDQEVVITSHLASVVFNTVICFKQMISLSAFVGVCSHATVSRPGAASVTGCVPPSLRPHLHHHHHTRHASHGTQQCPQAGQI